MSGQRDIDEEFVDIVEENLIDLDEAGDDIIMDEYFVKMQMLRQLPPRPPTIIPMGYMIIQPIDFDEFDEGTQGNGYENY